jgi:glycopeptide antibiotics resistance protein
LIVIRATTILSVVAMIPFGELIQGCQTRFFLVEKFALGVIDTGVIVD